jgi:cation:H+ antiporter
MKIAKNVSDNDPVNSQFSSELNGTTNKSIKKLAATLVISFLFMLLGAECLVRGATEIAKEFDVSDLVVGLTIVAIGTSLPETAASITSLIKNKADIAIGNIIGSNMFNMLAVLGIPAFIRPTSQIDVEILHRDFSVMLILSVLLAILLFGSNKVKLSRFSGMILLLCFVAYQFIIYQNTIGS